ncbi:MAG: helix-turn-helix domain-containing protein [Acetatifactor sp.]
MEGLNQEIGKRISQTRRLRGITQEKLAEELDITIKHMSSVERGVSSLSLEKLIELCSYFDCTLDYLILGTESNINVLPPSILSILKSNNEQEINLLLEYLYLYEKLRK